MAGSATARPNQRPEARLPPLGRTEEWFAASDLQPSSAASPTSPHDDAVGRLEGALAEQDHQRHRYEVEAAFETSLERSAYARLCEANEGVATRERWLDWIDQHWDRGRSTAPSAPSEETK
jgi:hypothetical protein